MKSVRVLEFYDLRGYEFLLFLKSLDVRLIHEIIRRLSRFLKINKISFLLQVYLLSDKNIYNLPNL